MPTSLHPIDSDEVTRLNQVSVAEESSSLQSVVGRKVKPLPKNRRACNYPTDVGRPGERPHVQRMHYTVPVSPEPPLIMQPGQAALATAEDVLGTVAIAQSVVEETCALRYRVDSIKKMAEGMKDHVKNLRTIVLMQRVKRERIRTYIDTYQPTERNMPWETLWGKKNGDLILKARQGSHHTAWATLEASPSELPEGVDVDDLPELGSSSETDSQQSSGSGPQKRVRGHEEDDEQVQERRKRKRARVVLAGGLFDL